MKRLHNTTIFPLVLLCLLGVTTADITIAHEAEHDHAEAEHAGHDHGESQHKDSTREEHDDNEKRREHGEGEHGEGEHGEHEAEHGKHEHGHSHDAEPTDRSTLAPDVATSSGITTAPAGPAHIAHSITLTGLVTLNPNTSAAISARFPGVVQAVYKSPGDTVAAGDVVATVESNENLQRYPVKSPIAGTVLSRNAQAGDVTGGAPLFTVADTSTLWVEWYVFPQDIAQVAVGQTLHIKSQLCEKTQDTRIINLLPTTNANTQTVLARTEVRNLDNHWLPGTMVYGELITDEKAAAVTVNNAALQRMEGRDVVFVKVGNDYVMRPVTTGLRDDQHTEIVDGLAAGEQYVNTGSFIVKADIGKSTAEHEH